MKQKIFGVTVAKLTASFGQTIYMVGLSLFFGAILGILLALVLVLCRKGGLKENRIVYGIVSTFVNIVRSVPFVILIVTIMPLTRAIMGTTIGSTAALVPLIFYISPYMARLVENSLLEVSDGIIEAARAMGATTFQTVWNFLLPEALGSIVLALTTGTIGLLGASAMAGYVGGGGIGFLPSVWQVDPETDECKVVYAGLNSAKDYAAAYKQGISTGIRGMCVYNDQLVISNVTMDAATGKSSATLLISSDPEKGFTQIADSDSLFNYPAYRYSDSIYGGSIWDMVEYNNSLYVSICTGTEDNMPNNNTMQSFALVRGDQNADGTFTWTPVAGDQKKDGARYTFGIDPERTRSGAANLMVFNDYLYIGEYNDEEIALERILFSKTGKNADGQFGGGLDCRFLNANLDQSVNLYRMDRDENMELVVGNATKMFPNGSLSGLGSGFGRNENQYIWRMQVYDGKLYVGTHDASSLLECFGQFVNGNLLKRTPSEWKDQWNYLKALMKALATVDPNGTGNPDTLAQTIKFSYNFVFKNITVRNMASAIKLLNYLRTAKRGFDLYVTEDGVNFETITIDGFGDPYNHGLRVFATTDQGLCLGTANPFYGTQIWIQRKAD